MDIILIAKLKEKLKETKKVRKELPKEQALNRRFMDGYILALKYILKFA